MLINRVGGSGENVTAEVNVQTPLVQNITELLGLTPREGCKYLWAKFTSEDGVFSELLISSQEDAYPDGTGNDGYYYQKIVYVVCADDQGTYLLEL